MKFALPLLLLAALFLAPRFSAPISWDFENDLAGWAGSGDAFEVISGNAVYADRVRPSPLGGDYWNLPVHIGHEGDRWLSSSESMPQSGGRPVSRGDYGVGELVSDEFVIKSPYLTFLVSGSDDDGIRVELRQQRGNEFVTARRTTGHDSELMRREVWNVGDLRGRTARIHLVDESRDGHLNVDDFRFEESDPTLTLTPVVERGRPISRDPQAKLTGIIDTHLHLMTHLGFGGQMFHGTPDHDRGIAGALPDCSVSHGKIGASATPEDTHSTNGFPEFDGWPRFDTMVHQQAHVDWLKRAFQGGLKMICSPAVNNQLLADRFASIDLPGGGLHRNPLSLKDSDTIDRQIQATKDLARKHASWMEIAYSPADARRIIQQNKMAILLAVEVDSLGDWKKPGDLPSDPGQARAKIKALVEELYKKGVRQITPIHLADNAFGGFAPYHRMFDAQNVFLTGEHIEVDDGWNQGVRYRLDLDPGAPGLAGPIARLAGYGNAINQKSKQWDGKRSHVNSKGLNSNGRILIEEMMRLGMIIDVDHMSNKTFQSTLGILEPRDYPVVSSHSHFADLHYTANVPFDAKNADEAYGTSEIHKIAREGLKKPDDIQRLWRLGSFFGMNSNVGDTKGYGKIPNDAAGTSKSFAQGYLYAYSHLKARGIGIGTDINGFNLMPCPRFGPEAMAYLEKDKIREKVRRKQADSQKNGVRYDRPLKDYRYFRWKKSDLYSNEENRIWQAIAIALSGDNIDDADLSAPGAFHIRLPSDKEFIRHIAKGLVADRSDVLLKTGLNINLTGVRPAVLQRAAFYAKTGKIPEKDDKKSIRNMMEKIRPIWIKFHDMSGPNKPLTRSVAGKREFDINLDGWAHIGLLPDFLQDLKNVGLTETDLAPLFRSAEDYIQMWEKCSRNNLR